MKREDSRHLIQVPIHSQWHTKYFQIKTPLPLRSTKDECIIPFSSPSLPFQSLLSSLPTPYPLNPATGSVECCSSPVGRSRAPSGKNVLVHFDVKMAHPATTVLVNFYGSSLQKLLSQDSFVFCCKIGSYTSVIMLPNRRVYKISGHRSTAQLPTCGYSCMGVTVHL